MPPSILTAERFWSMPQWYHKLLYVTDLSDLSSKSNPRTINWCWGSTGSAKHSLRILVLKTRDSYLKCNMDNRKSFHTICIIEHLLVVIHSMGLWSQTARVQILALPFTSCVSLGKWLNFSVPGFPSHVHLCETEYLKHLAQCQVHIGYLMNVSAHAEGFVLDRRQRDGEHVLLILTCVQCVSARPSPQGGLMPHSLLETHFGPKFNDGEHWAWHPSIATHAPQSFPSLPYFH